MNTCFWIGSCILNLNTRKIIIILHSIFIEYFLCVHYFESLIVLRFDQMASNLLFTLSFLVSQINIPSYRTFSKIKHSCLLQLSSLLFITLRHNFSLQNRSFYQYLKKFMSRHKKSYNFVDCSLGGIRVFVNKALKYRFLKIFFQWEIICSLIHAPWSIWWHYSCTLELTGSGSFFMQ